MTPKHPAKWQRSGSGPVGPRGPIAMDGGWLSDVSTDTLGTWNDAFKLVGWILAGIAAAALACDWITGRELERRRTAEGVALRGELETSRRAAAAAHADAQALRQRMEPRSVAATDHARMVEILRTSPGSITISAPADPAAHVYAGRLEPIFREAGWNVR